MMNRVLAGMDPVLMDSYVCGMMYYQPEEVPYITKAAALGVGCADIRQAEIRAMIPALDRLKQEGLLSNLTTRISIGQGYRNQKGLLGIGYCTRSFTCHLRAVPPTEEEIYEFFKSPHA